jgi:hypothetical protein
MMMRYTLVLAAHSNGHVNDLEKSSMICDNPSAKRAIIEIEAGKRMKT